MAAADYVSAVQQLYVAYFGRPADVDGLANFTAALDATGVAATAKGISDAYNTNATIKTLVDQFGTSAESQALYGSGTVESFVFQIYDNVLNRVPDAEGFAFWVNAISSGSLTRGNAAMSIMAGALANTSAQGLLDAQLINARITVATSFTNTITSGGYTYSGDAAAATARSMLDTVVATTDTTAFQSTITSTLATITNPNAGSTFTLTTATDTVVGTAGNDTITGVSANIAAGDTIVDQSSTDHDVLNLTLTAANAALKVAGVENVNVDWNAFTDAAVDATNITGSTVTLSSAKTGFLGNATITGTGANTIVAGTGMVGGLTANGVTGATINAGAAKTVDVAGTAATTDTVTVTAGANTTRVTVAGTVENATVTTGAKTTTVATSAVTSTVNATAVASGATVTVNGTAGTTDTASVTAGDNINVTLGAAFTGTEKLSLNIADGKTVTLTGNAGADTIDVAGAGVATVKSVAANITADTVTKSNTGALHVVLTDASITATVDTSKIAATDFALTAGVGAVLTGKTGQTFNVAAVSAAATVAVGVATDSAADTATLGLSSARYAAITQGANDIETLTIVASAPAITGADLTIDSLTQGGNTTVLTGTNDVAISAVVTPGTIDASALVGTLTVGGGTALASGAINGASGVNTITFGNVLADTAGTVVGQGGNDVITIATTAAVGVGAVEGRATFVLAGGNDSVNVTGVSAGTLTVVAGDGNDIVTLGATATGAVNLDFGAGTDTLALAAGVSVAAATSTIVDLDVIKLNGATATIDASLLSGKTYAITSALGYAGSTLTVNGAAAASTIDLSALVATDSATTGAKLSIVGQGNADVITGTSTGDDITGAAGADTLTGGAGNDTFIYAAGATGITMTTADTITDFTTGSDKLKVGFAGATAAVIVDGSGFAASTDSGFAAFVTAANAVLTAGAGANDDVYVAYNVAGTGNAYVAVDVDDSGTLDAGDFLIVLTGVNGATKIALADIIV